MTTNQSDDKLEVTPARSWKLYVRGAFDRPMVAEYRCEAHGRFALEVTRDAAGDPPAAMPCPRPGLVLADPRDAAHFDNHSTCGRPAIHVISAPARCKVRSVEAVRGGYQRSDVPTWTDTTNLGEGQDHDDWVADRDKVWEAEREAHVRELAREL